MLPHRQLVVADLCHHKHAAAVKGMQPRAAVPLGWRSRPGRELRAGRSWRVGGGTRGGSFAAAPDHPWFSFMPDRLQLSTTLPGVSSEEEGRRVSTA